MGYVNEIATKSAGSDLSDKANNSLMGFVIVLINSSTLVWPILRKILVGKHIEYYERFMWVFCLPRSCYMSWCGGQKRADAKRAEAKAARAIQRRAAQEEAGIQIFCC